MARTFFADFKTTKGGVERVLELRHVQQIGHPAYAEVHAEVGDYQDPDEIVGQGAVLLYGYEGDPGVVFHGVVEEVEIFASEEDGPNPNHHYRFRMCVDLEHLRHSTGFEIFQELTVKEIVQKTLESHGIPSDLQRWSLTGSYPKREYCVRYGESPLAFVSRLCEEEGIWFYTEPTSEGDKNEVVFCDDSTNAPPLEGGAELPYRARGGFLQLEDAITDVVDVRRVVSGKFVLRDYDFKKPTLDLTVNAEADADTDLERYDFPGCYTVVAEGKRLAKVRLEAEQATRATQQFEGDCTRLQVARSFELTESGELGYDGKYFITAVDHHFRHASKVIGKQAVGNAFGAGGGIYSVHIEALPAAVPYRAPQETERPVVHGPQTAMIVAPAGSQDQEIHTDEHGRAKVKFLWDRAPAMDDKASCWMRVGQLHTSGSMLLPRIGWEVVVQFLEGDPDRPVITGKVYNGVHMPPYALPGGKTRSAVQTLSTPGGGGMNEIRMEDKSGAQEISIHSQYDSNLVTANNKKKNVGNNETQSVGVNNDQKVGANQDVKVSKGLQRTIGGAQSLSVGGNRTNEVNAVLGLSTGGASDTTVGGNHFETNGSALEGLIAVATQKAAEAAAAAAAAAVAKVEAAVQGKVDQVMGPITKMAGQAQALGQGMQAVADGNLGAAAGVMAGAAGLPGAGLLGGGGGAGGGGGGGGDAGGGGGGHDAAQGGGGDALPGGAGVNNAATTLANVAVGKALGSASRKGVRKAAAAFEGGGGGDASGGGGASAANEAGPEGGVGAIDATDREKGPGHNIQKVGASLTETVGAMKVVASVDTILTNAVGSMTQSVGAAKASIVVGNHSTAIAASKTETALGLVILTKADETEAVSAMKTTMVGGAIAEKIGGSHTVVAGAMASFIGAFHKVEAEGKITFKCGGSTVVIDGSGVTIQSAMVGLMAPKIQLPKKTTEL